MEHGWVVFHYAQYVRRPPDHVSKDEFKNFYRDVVDGIFIIHFRLFYPSVDWFGTRLFLRKAHCKGTELLEPVIRVATKYSTLYFVWGSPTLMIRHY